MNCCTVVCIPDFAFDIFDNREILSCIHRNIISLTFCAQNSFVIPSFNNTSLSSTRKFLKVYLWRLPVNHRPCNLIMFGFTLIFHFSITDNHTFNARIRIIFYFFSYLFHILQLLFIYSQPSHHYRVLRYQTSCYISKRNFNLLILADNSE